MDSLDPTIDSAADSSVSSNKLATGGQPEFAPGDEFEEFRIIAVLGRGAFATVYLARQRTAERLVALKVSQRETAELIYLAKMDHACIVRVYDQRVIDSKSLHLLYIEYVPGGTLQDITDSFAESNDSPTGSGFLKCIDRALLSGGQAPPERSIVRQQVKERPWEQTVAWIGRNLADALSAAHRAGILHLDIKPANILLAADGLPKLTDFNVSLDSSRASADEAIGRGSIGFMSPEQIDAMLAAWETNPTTSNAISESSDVYSLAAVLWLLNYGDVPWSGRVPETDSSADPSHPMHLKTMLERARSQREKIADPNASKNQRKLTAVDVALGSTLKKALCLDPSGRPTTAEDFSGELRLAMHPGAARILQPRQGSMRKLLGDLPIIIVTAALLLVPNILAGIYNFFYNENEILSKYPQMRSTFGSLAITINSIVYPLALVLYVRFLMPLLRSYRGVKVDEASLKTCWSLGFRSASIGGVLWTLAGAIYPITLRLFHPEFATQDMLHFLLSLAICGGIAWTVPFFIGTTIGLLVYYPRLLRIVMQDDEFVARRKRVRRLAGRYVLAAALVPLSAAALHTMRSQRDEAVILAAIALTAAGLILAFKVYQYIESELDLIGKFLED
ncbi:MAG: serine/threonine-protein kinase [Planctomycetota bacterium]